MLTNEEIMYRLEQIEKNCESFRKETNLRMSKIEEESIKGYKEIERIVGEFKNMFIKLKTIVDGGGSIGHEQLISNNTKNISALKTLADEVIGGFKILKWIVGVVGVATIANIFVTIFGG